MFLLLFISLEVSDSSLSLSPNKLSEEDEEVLNKVSNFFVLVEVFSNLNLSIFSFSSFLLVFLGSNFLSLEIEFEYEIWLLVSFSLLSFLSSINSFFSPLFLFTFFSFFSSLSFSLSLFISSLSFFSFFSIFFYMH